MRIKRTYGDKEITVEIRGTYLYSGPYIMVSGLEGQTTGLELDEADALGAALQAAAAEAFQRRKEAK